MFSNDSKTGFFIVAMATLVLAVLYGTNRYTTSSSGSLDEEYELIQQYLLNGDGDGEDVWIDGKQKNLPKLWIHTTYEKNSREWKSFYSRNTMELNQPYIHLTVKTLVQQSKNSFQICLIDDASFQRLLPLWQHGDLTHYAPHEKTALRQLGLGTLIYMYGGLVIPDSFLCLRDLREMIASAWSQNKVVIGENKNMTLIEKPMFLPDVGILGTAKPKHPVIREYIEKLKNVYQIPDNETIMNAAVGTVDANGHVTILDSSKAVVGENGRVSTKAPWAGVMPDIKYDAAAEMEGHIPFWWLSQDKTAIEVIPATKLGLQNVRGKYLGLEVWMQEEYVDVDTDNLIGIWIPEQTLLRRYKYTWFAQAPLIELLASSSILIKYMKMATESCV